MRSRLAALALALATAAGCTKIVDTKDLEPLANAQGFCEALYSTLIEKQTTCFSGSPAWEAQFWSYVTPYCSLTGRSSSSGMLGYDRANAEACLARVRDSGCNFSISYYSECNRALVPLAQVGESCNSSQDCNSETTDGCFFIGSNTCPGKCLAARLVGDDCTTYGPSCGYGLYCDYTSTGRCVQGPAEGTACAAGYCGNGYYCSSSNTCLRYGRSGASCPGGWECDNSFYCDTTRSPQTCQPFPEDPIKRTAGDDCTNPYTCGPGLYCGDGNLCAANTTPAGQHCDYYDQCASGLLCTYNQNLADYVCARPPQSGEACLTGHGQCAYGLACRSNSGVDATEEIGTCVPPSRVGGNCGSIGEYVDCLESWCDGGTKKCAAYKADGAACTSDTECAVNSSVAECRTISAGVQQCKRTCG